MTNTDPVKNSEWERYIERDDKICPRCKNVMSLEQIEPAKERFYICYFCYHTEAEDESRPDNRN